MNKYKRLLSDTMVFAIGNFLIKLIQFLLMPLYTNAMTTQQYGIAELLSNSVELIYPIMTLGIYEAVFRFSLDEESNHGTILINSLLTWFFGAVACTVILAAIRYEFASNVLFVLLAISLRMLVAQFARGIGYIKSFSVSGIINVLVLLISNVTMLQFFHMGVCGYLLSLALGNLCSCIFLICICRLWRYTKGARINTKVWKAMLLFSLPMVPNAFSWWLTNLSGRYVVLGFCGADLAGMYAAASKLPAVVNMFVTIFQQAWQISAAKEIGNGSNEKYFENVFYGFYFIVIFMCGLVILVVPLLAKVLLKGAFYNAWRYVPVLIIATCLNCFSIYFGTLYNAAKKNSMIFFSTLLGAITNVSVCLLLVPRIGIWGACGASVCGYLVIVMIRIVDTRKIIKIPISKRFVLGNFCILALEAVSMAFGTGTMMLIAGSLFALISIMCIYQFHTKIHRLWS